ncbi:MAG TPA: hypothetical protein VHG28_07350 [Longimicrobiaceae bacterium]|nr:hypothetical protein [Longimicrobiaceae bacterium]
MLPERRVSPLAIDLTLLHRRSITSLYSNLVTRPTGRAIRTGVESQIAELDGEHSVCLSILDFSQVRVLDYSCADEIVAKLLLRYQGAERPAEAFFLIRGVQEHHREPIEEVLERHGLLLVAEVEDAGFQLLGRADPLQRACWNAVLRLRRASGPEISEAAGLAREAAVSALAVLVARRVVIAYRDGTFCSLPHFLDE